MRKAVVSGLAGILGVAGITGTANSYLYDDFSSGVLDANKWVEKLEASLHNLPVDQHFVTDGVYHTAQLNEADRGIGLVFKDRPFLPGESVEYDVFYNSGSGNNEHNLWVNGNAFTTSIFGFWNSIAEAGVGNNLGKYHIKVDFSEQGVLANITRPDLTQATINFPYPSTNYEFGFVTRTGHNGTIHLDYDNVYVNEIPEPSSLALLGFGFAGCGLMGRRRKR